MSTDYRALADRAVTTLTTRWFGPTAPSSWVPNDYWRTPTIICDLIDYAVLTGADPHANGAIRDTLDNAYAAGQGYLGDCEYLDDLAAWGRMFVAAAAWLEVGDKAAADQYREQAVGVFDQLDTSWDDTCGGGLWWKRGAGGYKNFKASVSTMQYAAIGASLHGQLDPPPPRVVAGAERAWAWEVQQGLVDEHHIIWGGMNSHCVRDPDNHPSAADQGHALGAFWGLYAATGDTTWLATACAGVDGTIAVMSWPQTSVLATPVDGQWRTESEAFREKYNDLALSKGLFVQNLGELAVNLATVTADGGKWQQAAATQGAYLRANADSLNAQYPQGVYDMDWLHGDSSYDGDEDEQLAACLQWSAASAFIAAAKNPG